MGRITHIEKGSTDTISDIEWDAPTTHLDSQGNPMELSRSATLVVAASNSNSKDKAGADYVCDGTDDDVQIQEALDAIQTVGGEVHLCAGTFNPSSTIIIPAVTTYTGGGQKWNGISLSGEGRATLLVLVANSDCSVLKCGDGVTYNEYMEIKDFCINGNKANQGAGSWHGVEITDQTVALRAINIWTYLNKGSGFYSDVGRYGHFIHCVSQANDEYGLYGTNSSYHQLILGGEYGVNGLDGIRHSGQKLRIIGVGAACNSEQASGTYFAFNLDGAYAVVIGCEALNEAGYHQSGFKLNCATSVITGCVAYNCDTGYGFDIHSTFVSSTLSGFGAYSCKYGVRMQGSNSEISGGTIKLIDYIGIEIYGDNNNIFGNHVISASQITDNSYPSIQLRSGAQKNNVHGNTLRAGGETNKPNYAILLSATSEDNTVQGNDCRDSVSLAVNLPIVDSGTRNVITKDNLGVTPDVVHEVLTLKNSSGGNLVAGDVVVWKAVATGREFDTTTGAGDDLVLGMLYEDILDTALGLVLIEGKTTVLKVDGTDDIAIGDFLCTFTSAGIAAKAGAGDMAFAIALEAYATDDSAGIIDAILITPRKI